MHVAADIMKLMRVPLKICCMLAPGLEITHSLNYLNFVIALTGIMSECME